MLNFIFLVPQPRPLAPLRNTTSDSSSIAVVGRVPLPNTTPLLGEVLWVRSDLEPALLESSLELLRLAPFVGNYHRLRPPSERQSPRFEGGSSKRMRVGASARAKVPAGLDLHLGRAQVFSESFALRLLFGPVAAGFVHGLGTVRGVR